ncbi:sigma-70 family RNA polymerase sigma factor [Peribacillus kribbensis]|uniref:sigma-70 family RNA polymerase sigma factor n=1 Tax=Peribacillus kribbensis TaxID=356658 RepID=UPI000425AA49|nr:sigma-70 family RNA polymerase sigma factor [Peribacillus kribbensis]
MYTNADDQRKMTNIAGGSDEMESCYNTLLKYCCFLAQNKWDGEDIAQDVYLKAVQSYGSEGMKPSLLKKMAYNSWIDVTRKRKKEILEENPCKNLSSRSKESLEIAELLLEKLTSKQAVIFLLKEGFGYTAREIGELAGLNETGVKSILHRAKKRICLDQIGRKLYEAQDHRMKEELLPLIADSIRHQDPGPLIKHVRIQALFSKDRKISYSANPLLLAA